MLILPQMPMTLEHGLIEYPGWDIEKQNMKLPGTLGEFLEMIVMN